MTNKKPLPDFLKFPRLPEQASDRAEYEDRVRQVRQFLRRRKRDPAAELD